MNDSFSQLAKKIRQNKINKREIKKIKREIIDEKVLNIIKNDMAIRIQKIFRGFLYRREYYDFLEQENTETIIDYLYEKKINFIHSNAKKIISNHISDYIINKREEKEKMNEQKVYYIDLIKAVLRGMLFRKKFKKEIYSLKEIQNKIERYILGYKIKLILRSNNIQSLLIDIANIKSSLNSIDKSNEANSQKVKELKTKLTKNINLFYFTFYQMKENSNWISQTKIKEPWIRKYMSIIYKDYIDEAENQKSNSNNNIFVKPKSIYSNQKKIRRLKENNSNKNNEVNNNKKDVMRSVDYLNNSKNNTISYDRENSGIVTNNEKENLNTESNIYSSNLNKENKDINNSANNLSGENNNKSDKVYDFNFYDSESDEMDDNGVNRKILHKGTYTNNYKNNTNSRLNNEEGTKLKKNRTIKDENNLDQEEEREEKDKKNRNNIIKRYKSRKNENDKIPRELNTYDNKEEENINEKDINDYNEEELNKNDINEKEIVVEKEEKKLNKYQLREERPIKPLQNKNFLENENPFGLKREMSEEINQSLNPNPNPSSTTKKKSVEKRIINSTRAINRAIINHDQKGYKDISEIEKEETIKTQEKTDLSHEELPVSNKYIEYDNRPCGGGSKNIGLYDFKKYEAQEQPPQKLDRNERPLAGGKKIDYNAMFGEGGGEFEGDPFGGAKQYETSNKDKVKNVNAHKSNTIKKKPVYDARKAIEEAKLKEAKEGKKEKPSAFREFLREMKKISAEEKAGHNETNTDLKNERKPKNKTNNKKNDIKDNYELNTESNINKLDDEEKAPPKKANKKQEKKNLNSEKDDKNDFPNSSTNLINLDDKENTLKKRHRGSVVETKEIALRRKLHELEKAPAPALNIKGIKSRIECWSGNNDNKRGKVNSLAPKETPKSKDEKRKNNNKQNDQKIISDFINNKKLNDMSEKSKNSNANNTNHISASSKAVPKISKNMEEKIEKYVDKKLMQLNVQIEEINDLFNFDQYFKEKEDKMKQYTSLPYIKKNYKFVTKYSDIDYNERMSNIEKIYKELK